MRKGFIYRMISPSYRIYIGQTISLYNRRYKYKHNLCKKQPQIYNSIEKYGFENHNFEIIEECDINLLNEREIHWKQYYLNINNDNWSMMLFCKLNDGSGGSFSEESKRKMSISHIGKKRSEESKKKQSNTQKGASRPISEERQLKIKIYKEENKEIIKNNKKNYNKLYKEENKEIIKEYNKEYDKKYYEQNKEIIKQKVKKYSEENKEIIKNRQKKYYQENKEKLKEYAKKRRKNKTNENEYI